MMFVATLLISRLVPLLFVASACLIAGRWLYDRYRTDRPGAAKAIFAAVLVLGLVGVAPYILRSAALVRAEFHMTLGNWAEVSRSFQTAERFGEDVGDLLRADWVAAEMNQQRFAEAEAVLLDGKERGQGLELDTIYQLAICRYYLNRVDEARGLFESIPDNARFFLRPYFLGRAAERRGESDAALAHYQRALELQPDLFAARYQTVRQLLARGDHAAAAAQLAAEPNAESLVANPHYQTLQTAISQSRTEVPPVEFILVQTVS